MHESWSEHLKLPIYIYIYIYGLVKISFNYIGNYTMMLHYSYEFYIYYVFSIKIIQKKLL
jgi:hypothetical protein